jgi:hypothetical protein
MVWFGFVAIVNSIQTKCIHNKPSWVTKKNEPRKIRSLQRKTWYRQFIRLAKTGKTFWMNLNNNYWIRFTHDMKNYQAGVCVINGSRNRRLLTQTSAWFLFTSCEFNNCFIIYLKDETAAGCRKPFVLWHNSSLLRQSSLALYVIAFNIIFWYQLYNLTRIRWALSWYDDFTVSQNRLYWTYVICTYVLVQNHLYYWTNLFLNQSYSIPKTFSCYLPGYQVFHQYRFGLKHLGVPKTKNAL